MERQQPSERVGRTVAEPGLWESGRPCGAQTVRGGASVSSQCGLQVEQFGHLVLHHDKPLSAMWWTDDGAAVLKVYRALEPRERRDREVGALGLAGHWGLAVPSVRAAGDADGTSWVLLDAVPATPSLVVTALDAGCYVERVLALTRSLRAHSNGVRPGAGWEESVEDGNRNSHFLVAQLSRRCRLQPWWQELCEALGGMDREDSVYLHGDIKPEHLLPHGRTFHVVDWEAAARGPAVCDMADAAFHVVRDLLYSTAPTPDLHLEVIARLPVTGPAAAWRLARWLDRRRPGDLALLSASGFRALLASPDSRATIRQLACLVAALRDSGVPR